MKNILFFVLCCTVLSVSAQAQLYIKKDKDPNSKIAPMVTAPAQMPAPVETIPTEPEAPPPPIPEFQQPEVKEAPIPDTTDMKAVANQYYQNCIMKDHPLLKGKNLEMICSCQAAKLPEVMTVPQMRKMQEATAEGQLERNRMLLFVYTPCIEHPTRSLVLDQCMRNEQLKTSLKHQADTCDCLADGMAEYIREKAPAIVQASLTRNMNNIDPLRVMLENQSFALTQERVLKSCLAIHEVP